MLDFDEKTITSFDGTEIYYNISVGHKHKKFLIFLHGLGGNLTAWDEIRSNLHTQGYTTLGIDLRGHGLSGRPTNPTSFTMDHFAKDILSILKKEKIKKPVLMGHCFGGMISILLEGTYPGTSAGMVLIDTHHRAPIGTSIITRHSSLESMLKMIAFYSPQGYIHGHMDFGPYADTSDFDFRRLLMDISHTSLKTYLFAFESMCKYDASNIMQKIIVPTLIVDGMQDSIFPPEFAKDLHHQLMNSEIKYIPLQNHMVVINHSKILMDAISSFLVRKKLCN